MNGRERSELAEEFLQFIGEVMRGTRAMFRPELDAYQITPPQLFMMKMVKRSGRMTVTDLSNSLMIAPPTASRMIDGLCAKGLLRREKDSSDHRVTLVHLTDESEKMMKSMLELQARVMAQVFEGEDPAELRGNIEALGRIARKWTATGEKEAREGTENG